MLFQGSKVTIVPLASNFKFHVTLSCIKIQLCSQKILYHGLHRLRLFHFDGCDVFVKEADLLSITAETAGLRDRTRTEGAVLSEV